MLFFDFRDNFSKQATFISFEEMVLLNKRRFHLDSHERESAALVFWKELMLFWQMRDTIKYMFRQFILIISLDKSEYHDFLPIIQDNFWILFEVFILREIWFS